MKFPELPMNPLGAAIIGTFNAVCMWLVLVTMFDGRPVGSAVAGAVVGMLSFGCLIAE